MYEINEERKVGNRNVERRKGIEKEMRKEAKERGDHEKEKVIRSIT